MTKKGSFECGASARVQRAQTQSRFSIKLTLLRISTGQTKTRVQRVVVNSERVMSTVLVVVVRVLGAVRDPFLLLLRFGVGVALLFAFAFFLVLLVALAFALVACVVQLNEQHQIRGQHADAEHRTLITAMTLRNSNSESTTQHAERKRQRAYTRQPFEAEVVQRAWSKAAKAADQRNHELKTNT